MQLLIWSILLFVATLLTLPNSWPVAPVTGALLAWAWLRLWLAQRRAGPRAGRKRAMPAEPGRVHHMADYGHFPSTPEGRERALREFEKNESADTDSRDTPLQ